MRSFGVVCALALSIAATRAVGQTPGLVPVVSSLASAGELDTANRILTQYKNAAGVTPEYIEAFSWLGRGQLAKNRLDAAVQNAAEVRKLCTSELTHRKLDAEPHLPTAVGASSEVEALALARQNRRDEAVVLIQDEIKQWRGT